MSRGELIGRTIRMYADQWEAWARIAEAQGRSIDQLMRALTEHYVKGNVVRAVRAGDEMNLGDHTKGKR